MVNKKRCYKCEEFKSVSDFYKCKGTLDGFQYQCKSCTKEYYARNKTNINEYKKEYRKNNKEKILEGKKRYYDNDANEKHKKEHLAEYYERNRDKILDRMKLNGKSIAAYVRGKMSNDIKFKLASYLRNRTRQAIKLNQKSGSAVKDLGCTVGVLKGYIEDQFSNGMTWDNWGKSNRDWSIDHIIPLSKVDLSDRNEFLKVAHYTNLRPMWHLDNIKKGNKKEDYSDPGVFVKPA